MSNLPLKKTKIIVAVLVYLSAMTTILFAGQVAAESVCSAMKPVYPIPRQVRYSFTLQNASKKLLKKAKFWTYAPVKRTSTQLCVNLETSHSHKLIVDELGNQVLFFELKNMAPYSNSIVTITADLMLSDVPIPIHVTDLTPFLKPEKYLESNDTSLMALAGTLQDFDTTKSAENIFSWVTDNVKYSGFSGPERGALYALTKKKGDCTEFMYLFAALCRAINIPARCVAGYICTENTILKPSEYHNWADIYDNGAWQTVDPQNRIFMQKFSHYIAMHILGDSEGNPMEKHHRFRFEGEGLKVLMNG